MTQAIADLPDPDELTANAPDLPDDLLSQLASREIDRWLAQGDAPRPSQESSTIAAQLNLLFSELHSDQIGRATRTRPHFSPAPLPMVTPPHHPRLLRLFGRLGMIIAWVFAFRKV